MAGPTLTVNGLKLEIAGFCGGKDLTDLEQDGPARGSDFVAQGVDGATFRPKSRDSLVAMCSFLVFGKNSSTGVVHPDNWSGIRKNVAEIRAATVVASRTALVTATVTYPDAVTRTAQVYCPSFDVGMHQDDRTGHAVTGVLEIVVPAGTFT